MIQALLWDSDGVLVDSEALFYETTRDIFLSAGLELTADLWRTRYLGQGLHSVEMARLIGASCEEAQQLVSRRNQLFRQLLEQPVALCPTIAQTLAKWHSRFRMGVVTSAPKRQFDLIHTHSGLLHFFECIVTADDCQRTKPDPEPYLLAMQRMNLSPRECLAIEDSPRGLASAAAAGIRCVVIQTPLTDLAACGSAHAVIDRADALDHILSLI